MNQGNPSGVTKDLRNGRCACEWSGDKLKVVCFAHLGAVREFDANEKKPAAGCYYANALHDSEGVANMHAESVRPVAVYLASDYDALTAERDQLRTQLAASDAHTDDLRTQRNKLLAEKRAAEQERDLLLQRNAMLVEALIKLAKRPSGHHDCDDYTRGYGQCQADMASIAEAALKVTP